MKTLIAILIALPLLTGCPKGGLSSDPNQQFVTCEEAVAYIATVDAALATLPQALPDNAEEVQMARAWYTVARTGAVAFLSRKCPDILKTIPNAP
jgi:hypothetical protein